MNHGAQTLGKSSSIALNCDKPRLISIEQIKRPTGYSIPGHTAVSATIEARGIKMTGFGEGVADVALKKAISEATERLIMKLYAVKSNGAESSNGWACHTDLASAKNNAIFELIERDVALTNWETNGPFFEIPDSILPVELLEWKTSGSKDLEFGDLKILLSTNSNGACISALLFNDLGNFVVGHASGMDLQAVILSATAEAMRAAHAALRFENYAEVESLHSRNSMLPTTPGSHSLAYAYKHTLPESIKITDTSETQISKMWELHCQKFVSLNISDFFIQSYKLDDLYIVRVRSPKHRVIHWGPGLTPETAINKLPHFVG